MKMLRNLTLLLCALALPLQGCTTGPRFVQRIGPAETFEPILNAGSSASRVRVDIAEPGYVSALSVSVPLLENRWPVLFTAGYPRFPTDPRWLEAGRHNLRPRNRSAILPMECRPEQQPTLEGCRRPLELLPGVRQMAGTNIPIEGRSGVLMIVSDTFIDPFLLAEQLYWEVLGDWTRDSGLREADAAELPLAMEALLEKVLGRSGWSAVFEIVHGAGFVRTATSASPAAPPRSTP